MNLLKVLKSVDQILEKSLELSESCLPRIILYWIFIHYRKAEAVPPAIFHVKGDVSMQVEKWIEETWIPAGGNSWPVLYNKKFRTEKKWS